MFSHYVLVCMTEDSCIRSSPRARPPDCSEAGHCSAQENASGAIIWCRTCGNNVHAECFAAYAAERTEEDLEPLRLYCGKFWPAGEPKPERMYPALGQARWPETKFRPEDAP